MRRREKRRQQRGTHRRRSEEVAQPTSQPASCVRTPLCGGALRGEMEACSKQCIRGSFRDPRLKRRRRGQSSDESPEGREESGLSFYDNLELFFVLFTWADERKS